MYNKPTFSYAELKSMALVANFAVKEKQVIFFYCSRKDTCFVLVDTVCIGYCCGDNTFRNLEHELLLEVPRITKPIYSFEREYVPAYASVVTQYLLTL